MCRPQCAFPSGNSMGCCARTKARSMPWRREVRRKPHRNATSAKGRRGSREFAVGKRARIAHLDLLALAERSGKVAANAGRLTRRGGRVVYCGGLENRWGRKAPGGSNPSLSARLRRCSRNELCPASPVRKHAGYSGTTTQKPAGHSRRLRRHEARLSLGPHPYPISAPSSDNTVSASIPQPT